MTQHNDLQTLRCAIHVHTDFDDGEISVEQAIVCAKAANVDALLLTDHHEALAAEGGWEGYHDDLLLVVGTELSSRHHHLLAFGVHDKVATRLLDTPDALLLLKRLGATVFVAHPQGRRRHHIFKRKGIWTDWRNSNFDGIEMWAYMHDWIKTFEPWRLPGMCRNPERFVTGPEPEILQQWDEAAVKRKVVGIGALDSHGAVLPFGLGKFFSWAKDGILPYQQNFEHFACYTLSHPLRGEKRDDIRYLLEGLREGRSWACHDFLHSGRAFRYYAEQQKERFPLGSEILFSDEITLHVEIPVDAEIRLVCRGATVQTETGRTLHYSPKEPGEYRVEVRLDGQFWILSNHIYLCKRIPRGFG